MSDIMIKMQILRKDQIVDEFIMNPLARLGIWEAPIGCDIAIMPERARLYGIKIECHIRDEKGENT